MSKPVKPTPGTKESRMAAAESRIEFWRIWSNEAITPEAKEYFAARLHHWTHVYRAIQMEQQS